MLFPVFYSMEAFMELKAECIRAIFNRTAAAVTPVVDFDVEAVVEAAMTQEMLAKMSTTTKAIEVTMMCANIQGLS